MSQVPRSIRLNRVRSSMKLRLRAMFRNGLFASLGVASSLAFPECLYAQDVNNSLTKNLQTNAVESAVGAYNNLSTGVLNFNGPSGAAEWSAGNLVVSNAGQVNLIRANLGIIGDVTNSGQFYIAPLGGIVQVDGHFTTSGANGAVIISGGGMELIGDLGGGTANFTNNSTALNGTVVSANRYLAADTITNASGGTMTNWGRLEGRDAIVNNGTLTSDAATSILKGNVTNNYILNARGSIDGNLTNTAGQLTTVKGNLIQAGNLTNAGTLHVADGNLTGTNLLTNTSTITIANARTLSAAEIKNNTGSTITGGNNSTISGTVTLENNTTITVGNGSTISSAAINNKSGADMTAGSNSMVTGAKLENSGTITVGAGSTVRSTGSATGDDLTNNASGVINFNGVGTSNLSSDTGTFINKGSINLNAGTILVTGNLTDTGSVAIADGSTFKAGSANQTIANSMTLAGNSTIDTNGFDATVSGNMTGTGGLTKKDLGELTFEGTNSFSGNTSIDAGQLTLKGGNAMADANAVAIGAVGKLKIQDAETIGSLSGVAGSETNLVADLTSGGNNDSTNYSGKIIGDGRLVKEGTGTMTLSGSSANSFGGGLTINNGIIQATTSEQLGTGGVDVQADAKLEVESGTTQSIASLKVYSSTTVDPITKVSTLTQGTVENSGTISSANRISNSGQLKNILATSVINGGVDNSVSHSVIDNHGTINGGVTNRGVLDNATVASVINGGVLNAEGTTNNSGAINGGVVNQSGSVNSDTATSVITDGLTNRADTNLRNQVSGAIINENRTNRSRTVGSGGAVDNSYTPLITVKGDLTGDSTFLNKDKAKLHVKDGNFTGITTLTNQSSDAAGIQVDATRTLGAAAVVNQHGSTIVNSGTLQSGSAISNSGTITNNTGAMVNGGVRNTQVGAMVTNEGTINGGIVQNFGTVNSLNANSVIQGGVNNSAYVNARGEISGPIVNNAQHTFADLTLTHSQANATGIVIFGAGASEQTFELTASGGNAVGSEGNGPKNVRVIFDADPTDVGTSTYDPENDLITVYVAGLTTTVQDIQTAINNGSGFTASGGTGAGTVDNDGVTSALSGGRDSGTALIRVLADATGSAAQNKQVAIINDNTIAVDTALASIDSATGSIVVKVNGDVRYADIASAIDDVAGFSGIVTTSLGDQGYKSTVDMPPSASTLTNGIFNVEGNLVADNTFVNGGHLNLNNGNLTGVTTFTNTGDVDVKDGLWLEAVIINNDAGKITLNEDSSLFASEALNNSAEINVYGRGDVVSNGNITNNATGKMTFGLGTTSDVSELNSGTNTIINNGIVNVRSGVLLTTGSVSGNGTIAMADGTTFRSGNNNQSITNNMTIANGGSASFDTNGNNASLSGLISGDADFGKYGAGNLTLSGSNTQSGYVWVDEGQLILQGGSAIADGNSVELYNNGKLKVSSAETIGSLATEAGTETILENTLSTGGNHQNTTSSGVINGAGGMVKQGNGTMTLDNAVANTYSGGTVISGGRLVAATNQQFGTGDVQVRTGATLTTNNGTTQTIAGLSNQGTTSLGNNAVLNVGSGHFNNSGTFNVGTGGSIVDTGGITNSGAINFSGGTATLSSGSNSIINSGSINLNAGTVLVKGNIVGNGSINMNNGTTLRSGNANQQIANGIRVNSGTAVIDTNGNNVNLTGTITGNGTLNKVGIGNLTWVGINNGNALVNSGVMITTTQSQVGNIQITNGSGVIFNQNTTGTYSGNVTGNGTFTKDGSGIVTMTGNSVYSGGTNVIGGTLRVGHQGTGQVQSNVNVGNSGTLGGSGTIIGNVSTQQGGRIAPGNSIGTLNISGNLNAGGSVVENEVNGTTSDLINVTGNANITNATLQNQFDATASYTTRMYRTVNAAGGVTGRFASVTNVNAPTNFLVSTYYTPTSANVVLTSLADATLASSTTTSLLSAGQDYQTSIMSQVNGYQFGGLGTVAGEPRSRVRRNVWFKGLGFFSDVSTVGASPGYSANTGGAIVGIDQVYGENTRIGIAGGYTITNLVMGNAARAKAEDNSARFNLYGAHSFDSITLSGVSGYAYHDVDSHRNLVGVGVALGKQAQNEASLNLQLTMNLEGEVHSLLPYAGIQWVHLSQNAYSESGTPGFDMVFNKATVDSLRPYLGLGYQTRIVSQSGLIAMPYLFTRYSRETIENSHIRNLSINGSNFTVAGVQPSHNIVGLGGGINSQFRRNMDWYLGYNVDLADRATNQNASGGLGFKY